ncbi:MAG: hypothetical protein RL078_1390, partial [Bacteroidota bacterium]
MKRWLKITLWLLFTILVATVFFFAIQEEQRKILRTPDIAIHVEGESAFLTEAELLDRLKIRNLFRRQMAVGELKIHTIERNIKVMPEVKKVEVYKHIGNKWEIQLELRKP